jgi:hypothetical protein
VLEEADGGEDHDREDDDGADDWNDDGLRLNCKKILYVVIHSNL